MQRSCILVIFYRISKFHWSSREFNICIQICSPFKYSFCHLLFCFSQIRQFSFVFQRCQIACSASASSLEQVRSSRAAMLSLINHSQPPALVGGKAINCEIFARCRRRRRCFARSISYNASNFFQAQMPLHFWLI